MDLDKIQPTEAPALERGGVYVLLFDHHLSQVALLNIKQQVAEVEKKTGCKFIVLDGGVRLAKLEGLKYS